MTTSKERDAETCAANGPIAEWAVSGFLIAELLQDLLCQVLMDLTMAWHRLGNSGLGIHIPIVLTAMPDELAPELLDFADQIGSLHEDRCSSATLRIPGIAPLVRS